MSTLIDGDIHAMPMREALLQHLDRLNELSFTLFSSLVPGPNSGGGGGGGGGRGPMPDAAAFLAIDRSFAAALRQARTHQIRTRRIERLKEEVLELEEQLRGVVRVLDVGVRELEEIGDEGEGEEGAIARAKADPIRYDELMQYAEHLAIFTSMPPSFPPYRLEDGLAPGPPGQGAAPAVPFNPPFPTQEQLRRGRLNLAGAQMSIAGAARDVGVAPDRTAVPDGVLHGTAQAEQPHAAAPTRRPQPARPAMADIFGDLDLNPDL